ncbi:phosphate:acyl-[acyl carrier protein] acyltransferase [Maritalea mobilis]|uniref:Phosphate acyltransferase n=1 Tax=Maritalea mobilis TaxID=483324 RepID=A0A4R6VTW8_9HYPH|nr:phosphate acyltransferase PlsX [Maritalea mobilis]TDQ66146.1 phosphate:acyl-[acyl carrier protein] acyltransferase [Maritalea mobilis]
MSDSITISVDAMGGDNGPKIVVEGAALALIERPNAKYIFHGREDELKPLLAQHEKLQAVSEIRHCDNVISMDDKPSQALRKGRGDSSMWNALQSVKDGEAQAAISGGNTGALMAMATFCLRPMDGISRPALAALWPTLRSESVVLDVGATVGADEEQLIDFSILGAAMARALFDVDLPTIGLLNVGVEEVKGLEAVKDASKQLHAHSGQGFKYHGFVEGDDLGKGTVDVVVTEGFTGNIALKTAEGTARQVATYLRTALSQSWLSKLGALLAMGAMRTLRSKMDPRTANGAVFLGVNGIVIKSHGGTDEIGFKSALGLTYEMAHNQLINKISEGLREYAAHDEANKDKNNNEVGSA